MTIPLYRFLEVAVYSLMNLLPYLAVALHTFRRHLRFSKPVTVGLVGVISVIHIMLGYLEAFRVVPSQTVSLMKMVVYAGFFFLLVKDQIGRLAFVLLVFSNLGNLVTNCAKCLEGIVFGDLALEACRWSLTVCMVVMHLVITVPVVFFVRKNFNSQVPINTQSWWYIWVIPATFYIIWYQHLYFSGQDSLSVALDWHQALFLVIINAGAFVVYRTAVALLFEQQKNAQLEKRSYLLSLQTLQHENLQQRINEARQAKHDVHHHAHLIREYLHSGKLTELENYLEQYTASLPDTQLPVYCPHYETNILLSYFVQEAKKHHIEMDVMVQFSEKIRLTEITMSIMLGNLLENAIDGCKELPPDQRKITVRGKHSSGFVFLEVTNPFAGKLKKNSSGFFLSTKVDGHGLGLHSVADLAERHSGVFEVSVEENTFRAAVMLQELPES